MNPKTPSGAVTPGSSVGGHPIVSLLGHGGSGEVYEAIASGRRVALKLLPKSHAEQHPGSVTAFQREFHRLEQLKHPRIIEVYECGTDPAGLFYTMELLPGGELRDLGRVGWKRACELLRDVALSLAIMHSRRLLHRDVSPSNVRCDAEGRAKLIDFGATTTVGVPPNVVGTPQCMPPEALRREALGARTDLFGLGALAYWLLTGTHAYPAHTFAQLEYAWKTPPGPPSAHAPEVPATLDQLVTALLRLDVNRRPASAMEVINRLEAIAGLDAVETVDAAGPTLVSPALSGRAAEVELLREHLRSAVAGNGGCVLIEGDPGVGRSRLLSQVALETGGADVSVLRPVVDPVGQQAPNLSRAVAEEIRRNVPETAREAVRARLGGEPKRGSGSAADSADALRAERKDIHDWILEIARVHPLVFLVDDVHQCDRAAAQTVAALALAARGRKLLVVATRATRAPVEAPDAVQALCRIASRVRLQPLDASGTESLIQSVFGGVPHLKHLADWVHDVAGGNPAQSVELLQYLIDRGIARYSGGTWDLPEHLDSADLPTNVAQAFDARITSLSPRARALAELLAVFGKAMRLDQVLLLAEHPKSPDRQAQVFSDIDELVAAQVVLHNADTYDFAHVGMAQAVGRLMSTPRRKALHLHIGETLGARYTQNEFEASVDVWNVYWATLAAFHLALGGEELRALHRVMPATRYTLSVDHIPVWEGNEWYGQFCLMNIDIARRYDCTPEMKLRMWTSLLQCGIHIDHRFIEFAEPAFELLARDTGLIFLDEIDEPDPGRKIRQAIARAFEAHHARPEAERGLDPIAAIGELVRCVIAASSICAYTFDVTRLRRMRELLVPFVPLSPATQVWLDVADATLEHCTGRADREIELRQRIAIGLESDTIKQVTAKTARTHLRGFNYYPLGQTLATRNPERGLELAELMDRETPFMEYEAWQVRLLALVLDGNAAEAQACSERLEMAAVQGGATKYQIQASGLQYLSEAYSLAGDLLGLKHAIEKLAPLADDAPAWRPFYDASRAQYFRLRGQLDEARAHAMAACAAARAGEHRGWLFATSTRIQIAHDSGQFEEACHLAEHGLRVAQRTRLGADAESHLLGHLAEAEIASGNVTAAQGHVDQALELAEAVELAGIRRGHLHEVAARIALDLGDPALFEQQAALTARYYCAHDNAMLLNRHRELLEEAGRRGLGFSREEAGAPSERPSVHKAVESALRQRGGGACGILGMLLAESGATAGFLFRFDGSHLTPIAPSDRTPPQGLSKILETLVLAEGAQAESGVFDARTTTLTTVWKAADGHVFQVAALSVVRDGEIRTVGAVALAVTAGEPPRIPRLEYLLAVGALLEALPEAADRSLATST